MLVGMPHYGLGDFGIAAYSASTMQPIMPTKILGELDDDDFPAAMCMSNSRVYVTGKTVAEGTSVSKFLTGSFTLDETTSPNWENRFGITGAEENVPRAISVAFDGSVGQPSAGIGGGLLAVAGSSTDGSDQDFLTVWHSESSGAVVFTRPVEQALEAVSIATFTVTGGGNLDGGDYFYVTGKADSPEQGTNIFTKCYLYDPSNTEDPLKDQWPAGATWNRDAVDEDEAAVQLIITASDQFEGQDPERITRALVVGWTKDASNNRSFVTLKYDAELQSSGNKEPKWSRIEDDLFPNAFDNIPAGIAHRVIEDTGEEPLLNFFTAGFSNAGSSGKDVWTVRFKEVQEN